MEYLGPEILEDSSNPALWADQEDELETELWWEL